MSIKQRCRSLFLGAFVLGFGAARLAWAGAPAVGQVEEAEAPVLDGVVDEQVWTEVEPFTGFTQQNPIEGAPATEKTEVRLLLTRQTLYVGIIAFDSDPSQILVTDSRRDGELTETDSIQLVLDTYNDNQNAFLFGTSPVGIEYDGQVAGEGLTGGVTGRAGASGSQGGQLAGFNPNWDGDWSVRAQITERGWEAEMAIPLKTLRYAPGEGKTWGFNVERNIRRKNEQVFLAPIPRGYNLHRVSLATKIEDLDLPGRRDIKLIPYGAARTEEDNLAVVDPRQNSLDVGLDVKWGVTPNLTADLTANTDFAQVEADDQQINLTRFPLFFPEKRPFFLENASTFQFGAPREVDLFFSRRIGLGPGGVPIPIIGGGRLSGKLGSFNVGALDMQTNDLYTSRTLDPVPFATPENFGVVRIQREVGRSNFGGIFVNRQTTGDNLTGARSYSRSYGLDAAVQLSEKTKLFTFVAGSSSPDDGNDWAGRALVNYATNWWNGHVAYTQVGERFRADAGFLPRRGYRKAQGRFFLDWQPEKYPWIRRFSPHISWEAYYGFDDEIQTSRAHMHFFEIQPQVGGRFGVMVDRFQDQPLENFNVYSGADGERVVIPPGLYTWYEWKAEYRGNPSATVYFNGAYTWGTFYDGDLNRFDVTANLRVGAKLQSSVGWRRDEVSLPGGDFSLDLVPIRFVYSFTPLTSISALIQYNSQTADVSSNIRFALLDRSGTGLFVVYNDRRNTATFDRFDPDTGVEYPNLIGRSFIVKYTYLFDL